MSLWTPERKISHQMALNKGSTLLARLRGVIASPRSAMVAGSRLQRLTVATSAVQKEEAQIGAVEWNKNLVNCVSLTGYLANRLTVVSANTTVPLAKGQLKILTGRDKPPMYVDLDIWGDLAHVAADNLLQGEQIQVVGRLKKNSWVTREGVERKDVSLSLTTINRIVTGTPSQDFAGDIAPWDMVQSQEPEFGQDQSSGNSFVEDQTQGLPGWGNEQPSYDSNPAAQSRGTDAWTDLLNDPDQYEDFRVMKQNGSRSPKFPDFKHKETSKALWIDSAPQWAKDALANIS